MKYSVIIPVYKAEDTIRRCLDSLLQQPHEDVELLVINDGSPDASGEISREYAQKHSCIRYFEKENGGVSTARNLGLDHAKGKYILFVDSDDYVAPGYFGTLNAVLDAQQPDMLLFGLKNMGPGLPVWDTGNYTVTEETAVAVKIGEAVRAYLFSNLMSKVFRSDMIREHGLKFDESLCIAEDQTFIFQYALHVKKLVSISDALYHLVTENGESLSRKRRDYLAEQLLRGNCSMLEALNGSHCSAQVRKIHLESIAWAHYRSAYSACKELLKFDLNGAQRRRRIRQICRMYTVSELMPTELKCRIIAFPIIHGMSFAIDAMAKISYMRRHASE